MQIKSRSKTKKILLILTAVVVIGAAAFLIYLYAYRNKSTSSTSDTQTTALNTDNQQSKNLQSNPDTKTQAPNADQPAPPITSSTSSKKQVEMTASTDSSNGTVYIRGGVNYPVVGGSCYAELTGPSGQSVRKDTTVLQNPASTDCKTIVITTNSLASGKWSFILHYTSDNYEGASDEVSFSV